MRQYCDPNGDGMKPDRRDPNDKPLGEIMEGFMNLLANAPAADPYWRGYIEAMRKSVAEYARTKGRVCPDNHLPVHVGVIEDIERVGVQCLDGGACHHQCDKKCSRQDDCVPLSIADSYLTDDWHIRESTPAALSVAARGYAVMLRNIAPGAQLSFDRDVLNNAAAFLEHSAVPVVPKAAT